MNQHAQIIDAIAKQLGVSPADIDSGASLADDLGLGPIEISDLIAALVNRFNVNLTQAEVENVETVEDLIALIEDALLE